MAESHREEIAKLEALYASNPGGRVFVHLAEAYRRTGEHERARRILEDGLSRHNDSVSGYVVLGRVLTDLDELTAAESAFRRVVELDEGNLIALRSLADIARAADRLDEAADYYNEALSRNPSDGEVRTLLNQVQRDLAAQSRMGETPAETPSASLTEDVAAGPHDPEWNVAPEWGTIESSPVEPVAPPSAAPGQIDEPGDSLAETEFGLVELDALPGDYGSLPGDLDSLSGDLDSLPGDLDSLPGDLDSLPGGFDSLPGDLGSLVGDHTSPAEAGEPADALTDPESIDWGVAHGADPEIETDLDELPESMRADLGADDLVVAPLDVTPWTVAPTADLDAPAPDDTPAENGFEVVGGEIEAEAGELEIAGELEVVDELEAVDEDLEAAVGEFDAAAGQFEAPADESGTDGEFDEPVAEFEVDGEFEAPMADFEVDGEDAAQIAGLDADGEFEPHVAESGPFDEVQADGEVYDAYTAAGFEGSSAGVAPVEPPHEPAADDVELNTETIAELYRSQGFYGRAADIYRVLLQQRPDDERLAARLREVEQAEPAASADRVEQGGDAIAEEPAAGEESGDSWLYGAGAVWVRQETAAEAETPYSWTSGGDEDASSPPIRRYLQELINWRGAVGSASAFADTGLAADTAPAVAAEPAVDAEPAVGAAPPADAAPAARAVTSGPAFPWDDSTLPEADAAPGSIAEEAGSDDAGPDEAGTESAGPWSAAVSGAADSQDLRPASNTGDPVEDAFLDWYGGAPDSVPGDDRARDEPAASGASLDDFEEEADDEDLEMFRTWLKSLKK